jgi:ribonuclease HII
MNEANHSGKDRGCSKDHDAVSPRQAELCAYEQNVTDKRVAGVDEAGRGPLAGDVYAAAVILDVRQPIEGLTDSKKLTALQRQALAPQIRDRALAWSIAWANVDEIDRLNILQATLLAMQRAVDGLTVVPHEVLVDGNRVPALPMPARAIVKGDLTEAAISAASILAKTARDAALFKLHEQYPQYAFDQHKGYGTALHMLKLREFGPCPAHRRSFAPVARLIADEEG